MTLEQAIDGYTNNAEYERIHGSLQGCLDFRQLAEWLKDYKRLLEQQPCDDAISRNAVIQTLNKMDRYTATELTLCDTDKKFPANEVFIVDDVYEQIAEQLPSVTRQTGEWVRKYDCIVNDYFWECNKCECGFQHKYNFCPNCGCHMVEPQGRSDKCKNCEYFHNPDYTRCHECNAESEDKE